jgi:hypothetical protein
MADNLLLTLYSMYAVLGFNSWIWHVAIECDGVSVCVTQMVELWTRKGNGGYRLEHNGRWEEIREIPGTTCLFGL